MYLVLKCGPRGAKPFLAHSLSDTQIHTAINMKHLARYEIIAH